jgi:hypothetical protein
VCSVGPREHYVVIVVVVIIIIIIIVVSFFFFFFFLAVTILPELGWSGKGLGEHYETNDGGTR